MLNIFDFRTQIALATIIFFYSRINMLQNVIEFRNNRITNNC